MTRRQKDPLRALTNEEQQELERISRATSESATRVARAKALLAVAQRLSYIVAAQGCDKRSDYMPAFVEFLVSTQPTAIDHCTIRYAF
jgi:hypothetical protein